MWMVNVRMYWHVYWQWCCGVGKIVGALVMAVEGVRTVKMVEAASAVWQSRPQ